MANKTTAFRPAKAHVLKHILQPAGFTKGKELFVRKKNGQIHGIEFQTHGRAYFVNVAFHYDFLPPVLAMSNGTEPQPYEQFHLLDFMLWTRLEGLLPAGYPKEWEFPEKQREELTEQIGRNARDAIDALDKLSKQWRDPATFLKIMPADLLKEDYENHRMDGHVRLYEKVLPGIWERPDYFNMSYYLSIIALRADRPELAKSYLDLAELAGPGIGRKAIADLRAQLETVGRSQKMT